jgi:hypothetical protein
MPALLQLIQLATKGILMDEQKDLLGGYDEMELIELGEADVYGGTNWACALVSAAVSVVSSAILPTTKCTSKCGT